MTNIIVCTFALGSFLIQTQVTCAIKSNDTTYKYIMFIFFKGPPYMCVITSYNMCSILYVIQQSEIENPYVQSRIVVRV